MSPAGVAYFPVRHHSPRVSAALVGFLERVKPALVLVEGPRDATRLVPFLFDADTVPPIAILGYRAEGASQSVLYPLASYSPEYVALRWAHEHGVASELIDITTGESLAADREATAEPDGDEDGEEDEYEHEHARRRGDRGSPRVARRPSPHGAEVPRSGEHEYEGEEDGEAELARAHGFRSFEELWEAWFEAPAHDPGELAAALLAWGEVVRLRDRVLHHRARDVRMAHHVAAALARGVPADKIVVVVGAAHAAALAVGDVDPALADHFVAAVATELTIIPYSFTRLAGQVGYGAGNRAPRYYQKAHDAGCDYTRATLEVLVEFTEHLRLRGFAASLADTIEAYRLAVTLASHRGKHAPGLDEIREATIATMCRGDASHVDQFLWSSVIGTTVGKVGARLGQNSLQTEFWREIAARGLPRSDEQEAFTLKLADPVQAQTSTLLHRLRVAAIPYAVYRGAAAVAVASGPASDDEPGGLAALSRVREHWAAQWTPSTDVALVERIVDGETLGQVVERRLTAALTTATTAGGAAHLLMEAVVVAAPEVIPEALAATERLAATDDDLGSLAAATRALTGLVSFGTTRGAVAELDELLVDLASRTFTRAVLRVESAATGGDDAMAPVIRALRTLHEIAASQTRFDTSLWFTTARTLVDGARIHGACAGCLAGLLYLAERLDDAALVDLVTNRLSSALDPGAAAAFLEGFLAVNALVLVKHRGIVGALDGFLQAVPDDRFRDVLPVLRRAFAGLGATERRYLIENLLAVRAIGAHGRAATAVLAAKDVETLKAMDADLGSVMDDLDGLL